MKYYEILAKDIRLKVFPVGYGLIQENITSIQKIDKTSIELSKHYMGVLVRKARFEGEPKPDDQEKYQEEYAKQLHEEASRAAFLKPDDNLQSANESCRQDSF